MYVCMYVFMYICMCVCMHYVHKYSYTLIVYICCIQICIPSYMLVSSYVAYVYTCIYIKGYDYIYIYTV